MKAVFTNNAPAAIGPYSQGLIVGGWLYTSGQTPLTPDGVLVEGDITIQAKQVLSNLKAVLTEAGYSTNDVVKATVYLKDMKDFPDVNKVYGDFFGEHRPTRTTVQVAALPMDAQVEIDFVAYKSE